MIRKSFNIVYGFVVRTATTIGTPIIDLFEELRYYMLFGSQFFMNNYITTHTKKIKNHLNNLYNENKIKNNY